MSKLRFACLLVVTLALAADPSWKSKPTPEWTKEDALQILADSPWSKRVNAAVANLQTEDQRRESGNMGQEHGIGFDGIRDNRPRVQAPKGVLDIVKPETAVAPALPSITLQLRWESALPVRVAELKTGADEATAFTDDGYSLVVYGVPGAHVSGDPKSLGEPLRKQASLKREGKKDVKPSSVEVIQRDGGLVVVYSFPLSAEISEHDDQIEFEAQIGRLSITQSFHIADMLFNGKLEL